MTRLQFGSAALGEVPNLAVVAALSVAGKKINPAGADISATTFGSWANGDQPATPINLLSTLGRGMGLTTLKFTEVAPGGRAADDIAPGLKAGKKKFTPKEDMYGIIAPVTK